MGRLFGTDGVRGLANAELTPELALAVSVSAARVLGAAGQFASHTAAGQRPIAVVGRDPRASGEMLEAAVVAGFTSVGVDVLLVGVLPTPAVAFLVDRLDADFGVMLSASHNSMPDNGIKLFSRGGHKLADELEDAIEAELYAQVERPIGAGIGRVHDHREGASEYVEHLLSTVPHDLTGLKVVVDCANGAASVVGPEALRRAGAEVIAIHATPDGLNINAGCGSTHMDDLTQAVRETGADIGIAHDGDADRCLAVDASGAFVDGDQILAILGLAMRERGELRSDTVVATVMANLGFKIALEREGLSVIETAVGDRYVLEEMKANKYALGGEQSGHVVMLDHATTGDGVLTALHLLARMASTGRSLADLASVMTRLPQVLINVRDVDKTRVDTSDDLRDAVVAADAELGTEGRVLLRPSGTEPVVRVMVEAASEDHAREVAERLAAVVARELAFD